MVQAQLDEIRAARGIPARAQLAHRPARDRGAQPCLHAFRYQQKSPFNRCG